MKFFYKFSFYLFLFSISYIYPFSLRKLYSSDDLNNVCMNIDKDYKSKSNNDSFLSFINNLFQKQKTNNLKKEDKEFLSNLIVKGKLKDFIRYFEKIIFNIVFSSFSLISLIIWIILIICSLREVCLFRKTVKYGKCANFSLITSLILFLFVLICSIYSFRNIKQYFFYFNGSTCSLMKFFYNFNNGMNIKKENEKEINYNWPGLLNINLYLNKTSNVIEIINNKTHSTFSYHKRILKETKNFKELIEDLHYNGYVSFKNPNENNKSRIYPIYTKQFKDLHDKNLTIGKIYDDYNINFKHNSLILDDLYRNLLNISQNKEEFIADINNTTINLKNFSILMVNMSETLSENFFIFHNLSFNILWYFFEIIHIYFISISILTLLILPVYSFIKEDSLRLILNIIWNSLFFVLIISFILGAFILSLTHLSKDIIPIITEFLSEDYINSDNSLFPKLENAGNFLNTCLNKNGNLIEILKLRETSINNLNENIKLLNEKQSKLKFIISSNEYKQFQKYIDNFIGNYSSTTDESYGTSDILYLLNEITKITNGNKELCNTNDIWVTTKKNCKEDYIYLPKREINHRNPEKKYCLIIQDKYDEITLMQLYARSCSGDSLSLILNRILSLTTYYQTNENLLDSLSRDIQNIQHRYRIILNMINEEEKKVNLITNLLTNIYAPEHGINSIYDMFNCNYLKNNIIDFYDQFLNYFVKTGQKIGTSIILCSIASFLSIFFLISSIMRNSKEAYKLFLKERNKEMNDGVELLDISESLTEDDNSDESSDD